MIKRSLLALAGLAIIAGSASADPILSYNTVDLGYKWTHFDDSDFDNANGLEAKVSYSPAESMFLELGYEYFNTEINNFDVDNHTFRYGGGGFVPFGCDNEYHFVGRVGGLHTDLNGDYDAAASDDGVYVRPEIRAKLMPELELAFGSEYQYYGDFGNAWIHGLQAFYTVSDDVALSTKVELSDDSDVSWLAGVRFAY